MTVKKVDQSKPTGVSIGIPYAGRPLTMEWVFAMLAQTFPMGMKREYDSVKGEEIADARNMIAEMALKNNCKYLWFVDDDTIPPTDACRNLIYQLEQQDDKVMAIGGVYCTRTTPPEPVLIEEIGGGPFWRWKVGEVFPCLIVGTGCMVVKTEVFNLIEKPWFKTSTGFNNEETEDAYFCCKVKEAGYTVMAHGGVLCRHIDAFTGVAYDLPPDSYPFRK